MLLWLSVPLLASALCPVVSCGSLGTVACTKKVSPTQLMLNDQNCAEGTSCSVLNVFKWWWDETTSSGSTHNCAATNSTIVPAACGVRPPLKDLNTGAHPKNCAVDADCTLEDGSLAVCACSLRSASTQGFCQPHPGDSLFLSFWQSCETMTSADLDYWGLSMQLYVYLQGDASCARSLTELRSFQLLQEQLVNAALQWSLTLSLLL